MKKRGAFFSTDAMIAITIVFITMLVFIPIMSEPDRETYIHSDLISTLSKLRIGDLNNSYAKSLIASGKIIDENKNVLEQLGEFYVLNKTLARNLGNSILSDLDFEENIGIWYGDELIASKNKTSFENSSNIDVERQTISGIINGTSVTGFSSRAFIESNADSKYFYFGGYVGQGNLSVNLEYNGNLESVKMEITTNEDFDVYINGVHSGHYMNSSTEFSPAKYDISAYKGNFHSGENLLEFIGDSRDLRISGGYIKIVYNNASSFNGDSEKYSFPGISGLINLYDSFYFPDNLNEMEVSLHLDTNYSVFFVIGNRTIFNNYTDGEETLNFNNAFLSSKLDYSALANKTVPLRLGLVNASYIINLTKDADVFSVTDLSGSMCGTCTGGGGLCCWWYGCDNDQPDCEACGGTCEDAIYEAKDANKDFVDIILNFTDNRAGLVGYASNSISSAYHALSTDNESLKNKIDDWEAVGGTCICCGINDAVDDLVAYSDSDNIRSIVIMSDGQANVECASQGSTPDLNGNGNADDAGDDAIQAACDAYADYGIIINSIGFGSGADEDTLEAIAACANGDYYYGDVSNLSEIYKNIATKILEATYSEQIINTSANVTTKLFPDSYIRLNYTHTEVIPYGLLTTVEKDFDTLYYGNFTVPENSTLIDVDVISYSGPRWTSSVTSNSIKIFNLSDYGGDFTDLGDPYTIKIPLSTTNSPGTMNSIRLTTGLSPDNESEGSIDNKIIYKIVKEIVSYSGISASSKGCSWEIDFEDGSTENINVPEDYTGSETCKFTVSENLCDKPLEEISDSIQRATCDILIELDFDSDDRVDVKFSDQDLTIVTNEIIGIPFGYSTEVQIRRWD